MKKLVASLGIWLLSLPAWAERPWADMRFEVLPFAACSASNGSKGTFLCGQVGFWSPSGRIGLRTDLFGVNATAGTVERKTTGASSGITYSIPSTSLVLEGGPTYYLIRNSNVSRITCGGTPALCTNNYHEESAHHVGGYLGVTARKGHWLTSFRYYGGADLGKGLYAVAAGVSFF